MQGIGPVMSYTALAISNKNTTVMIVDLHNINRVLEKVEMKESQVCYGHAGRKEDTKLN